ncbi:MAG: hypothetical protein ACJ764_04005 [Solirubrobacteraceae bacterium]
MRFRLWSAAAITVVLCAAGGSAAAAGRTQIDIYHAFRPSGKPAVYIIQIVHGRCLSGSDAVRRRDAWRCIGQTFLHDPCFSSRRARGIVLCPVRGHWGHEAVKVKLTKRLPREEADRGRPGSRKGLPWTLTTTKGWKCHVETRGTVLVDGRRLDYACQGTKNYLFGPPNRRREPWTILYGPRSARHLRHRVGIRTVWF